MNQLAFECDVFVYGSVFNGDSFLQVILDFQRMGVLNESIQPERFKNISTTVYFDFYNLRGFDVELEGPIVALNQTDDLIYRYELHFGY